LGAIQIDIFIQLTHASTVGSTSITDAKHLSAFVRMAIVTSLSISSICNNHIPGQVTIKWLLSGTKVNSAFHPSVIGKSSTDLSGYG